MDSRLPSVCFWLLVGATSVPGRGATVLSNFGPGNSFEKNVGSAVSWRQWIGAKGEVNTDTQSVAMSFATFGLSYSLDAVTLGLVVGAGTTNLRISLVVDDGGKPGSVILETLAIDPTNVTSTPQALEYPSTLHPVLAAGATFWVVLEPAHFNALDASSNSSLGWNDNDQSYTGGFVWREVHEWIEVPPTAVAPSMSVRGTVIPEPGALALMGSALMLCCARRHL